MGVGKYKAMMTLIDKMLRCKLKTECLWPAFEWEHRLFPGETHRMVAQSDRTATRKGKEAPVSHPLPPPPLHQHHRHQHRLRYHNHGTTTTAPHLAPLA